MTEPSPAAVPTGEAPTIQLAIASERLRQEQITFGQRVSQDRWWFGLRFAMGVVAVVTLPAVAAVCGFVLLNPSQFPAPALTTSAVGLVTDVLALIGTVWKVVLNPASVARLEPVTTTEAG
jgi:alkanesulfonate monooxygenase SsuD/methylene tetrahydromethanopterin reductase-like flavin-dependent oxidoreductase (luciferase family)